MAYRALADSAAARGVTLEKYVQSGHDPTSVAVVAEDAAAVGGCAVAAAAIGLTQVTGSLAWDAGGSIAVGGLLAGVAGYLINSNRLLLLGRSLGAERMNDITDLMRKDPVVRSSRGECRVSVRR